MNGFNSTVILVSICIAVSAAIAATGSSLFPYRAALTNTKVPMWKNSKKRMWGGGFKGGGWKMGWVEIATHIRWIATKMKRC